MCRLTFIILLIVGSVGSAFAALPDDPALTKPVTLAVKGEALADIMPILQDQTGVLLRVARDIADQKATIFVDKKPLREVMEGLSTLFKYQWTSKVFEGRTIYELFEDEETRRDREDQWQKARAKAWEAALAEMKLKDQFGKMTKAERESYRTNLFAEMGKGTVKDGLAQLDALNAAEYEPMVGPIVGLVLSSPAVLKALGDGMSVHYDLDSPEPAWKLSDSLVRTLLRAATKLDGSDKQGGLVPVGLRLRISSSKSARAIDIEYSGLLSYRLRQDVTKSDALNGRLSYRRTLDYLELPADYLPHVQGATLHEKVSIQIADFGKDVSIQSKDNTSGSTSLNPADVLESLHRKLGMQIISDYCSYWYPWALPKEGTIGGILDGFRYQFGPAGFYAYELVWGWDGKYLYVRTKDVRYSNAAEIPNRLLRPWQQAYAKKGSLGFDELSQVAQLSEDQIRTVNMSTGHLGIGPRISIGDALRLYGMLSPSQREKVRGQGISLEGLTEGQREVLDRLMRTGGAPKVTVGIYDDGRRLDRPVESAEAQAGSIIVRGPVAGNYALVVKSRTPTGATMEESFPLM